MSTRPNIARLHELFRYEPETGALLRRVSAGRGAAGARVGWRDEDGYRWTEIDGSGPIPEAAVAWAMAKGQWPTGDVDHRNGVHDANWIDNLRDVTHRVNQQNRRKAAKHNKSGVLGVVLGSNGRYSARLCTDGRQRHLGCFGTAEEAHQAYLAAKRMHHEGCTL